MESSSCTRACALPSLKRSRPSEAWLPCRAHAPCLREPRGLCSPGRSQPGGMSLSAAQAPGRGSSSTKPESSTFEGEGVAGVCDCSQACERAFALLWACTASHSKDSWEFPDSPQRVNARRPPLCVPHFCGHRQRARGPAAGLSFSDLLPPWRLGGSLGAWPGPAVHPWLPACSGQPLGPWCRAPSCPAWPSTGTESVGAGRGSWWGSTEVQVGKWVLVGRCEQLNMCVHVGSCVLWAWAGV